MNKAAWLIIKDRNLHSNTHVILLLNDSGY